MIEATANVQLDQPRLLVECNAALLATGYSFFQMFLWFRAS